MKTHDKNRFQELMEYIKGLGEDKVLCDLSDEEFDGVASAFREAGELLGYSGSDRDPVNSLRGWSITIREIVEFLQELNDIRRENIQRKK